MDPAGMHDDVDVVALRRPLRMYDVLTKRIDRYTKRLDGRWHNRKRTETRLRKAEQFRHSMVGFIAKGMGTEKAAVVLGLSTDDVAADRQALDQWAHEINRPAIEEFMSRPETQRRLRSHDRPSKPDEPDAR